MVKKQHGFLNEKHIVLPNHGEYPELAIVISEIGYYQKAEHHYRERHTGAAEFILIYSMDGLGYIHLNNGSALKVKAGQLYCIPKTTSHRYYADTTNPWSILWMHFNCTHDQAVALPLSDQPISFPIEKQRTIQNHFTELLHMCERYPHQHLQRVVSPFLFFIFAEVAYLPEREEHGQDHHFLAKAIQYMNIHLASPLSLEEIAAALGVSASYLSQVFKQQLNQSPMAYLTELKMERACKFLRMEQLKIYQVAAKVGFQDPYYFSRVFKKVIGLSPKMFQDQIAPRKGE
ncbi:AraC-type DNA-binding protein [Amphibacillus marinus]|uniref:AraC-type DNA-binding protein n=1 Tax=Amphibacillus marinus TaxID=872970 RepID=A0A1H8H2B5_9BACI|nr:AraC family transcriptional regulator [Amphibacillus marinus]SEN50383.1 AraC-type DNA-binding protein [Amphibacillus marinus]